MLLAVPQLLSAAEVAKCRAVIDGAPWIDGRATVGYQGARVKDNEQVPEDHAATREAGAVIMAALERNALFLSAALPLKVYPPTFNRYRGGQTYGSHLDGAIRQVAGTPHRVRTDVSATVFLTAPEEYDGGELTVEDTYGAHEVKLSAGDMVLYPGTSLHRVKPVTRGARVAAFFWVQSLVRDDTKRALLFDMDTSIQELARTVPDSRAVATLTNTYNNLLRLWGET
jgi:PKHD-type hydroxylase